MLKKITLEVCFAIFVTGSAFLIVLSVKTIFTLDVIPDGFLFPRTTLVSDMNAYRVKFNEQGEKYLEPASNAAKGDVLEYQLTYTNTTKKELNGLVVTGPIPANTSYIKKSGKAFSASKLYVSIDGGVTYESEPVLRQVKMPNGKFMSTLIPEDKYTNIRWTLDGPMAAHNQVLFIYQVELH